MPPHGYGLTAKMNATSTCVENETSADVHEINPTKQKIPITRARLRFSALAGIQVFVCVWFFFVFRLNSKLHALKRRPLRRGDHDCVRAIP